MVGNRGIVGRLRSSDMNGGGCLGWSTSEQGLLAFDVSGA